MFPNKSVTWNWHHEYVCGLLQEFVLGDIDNLMVFMPPQHQKSTMMTEYLPAWNFGKNPNAECLLVMYNATMAAKYNRKIQKIIDQDKYSDIFPDTNLNSKNVVTSAKGAYVRNSEEFEIVGYRGFLKAVGVDGGIAGNPAKFSFMDDVIKNAKEAESKTYRESIYNWFTDELEARQHNDSKIAFSITRRHPEDLAGKILKRDGLKKDGGKWEVIVLPALKENNDNPNDPREIGEALFPELHSRVRMEERKVKAPRTFASLYQQRPSPLGGNFFKDDHFKKVKSLGYSNCHFLISYRYINDETLFHFLAFELEKDHLKILEFIETSSREMLIEWAKVFIGAKKSLSSILFIEHNKEFTHQIPFISSEINILPIQEIKSNEDDVKHRVSALRGYLTDGCFHYIDNMQSFFKELITGCKQYPSNDNTAYASILSLAVLQSIKMKGVGNRLYKEFNEDHVKSFIGYDNKRVIHATFDQNLNPYFTQVLSHMRQIEVNQNYEHYELHVFDEICTEPPNNRVFANCSAFLKKYKTHKSNVIIYGDASLRKGSTLTKEKVTGFSQIKNLYKPFIKDNGEKLSIGYPSVEKSVDFINVLLRGEVAGGLKLDIVIHPDCIHTIQDFIHLKTDINGGKLMEYETKEGVRYEKYGHTSDALRYQIISQFGNFYNSYIDNPEWSGSFF